MKIIGHIYYTAQDGDRSEFSYRHKPTWDDENKVWVGDLIDAIVDIDLDLEPGDCQLITIQRELVDKHLVIQV